jgi:ABC-type branched-subunit amino acid transport system ATPase component
MEIIWSEASPTEFKRKGGAARALVMKPKLLLLDDEPTVGMTRKEKDEMVKLLLNINSLSGLGVTILLI